jgi:hypothetical protein
VVCGRPWSNEAREKIWFGFHWCVSRANEHVSLIRGYALNANAFRVDV